MYNGFYFQHPSYYFFNTPYHLFFFPPRMIIQDQGWQINTFGGDGDKNKKKSEWRG